MRAFLHKVRGRLLKRKLWQTRIVFWGGALLVGVIAAGFAIVADTIDLWFHDFANTYTYLPLIITPLGMVAISYAVRNWFKGAQGSGVPQSLAVMNRRERGIGNLFLTPRIVVGKILLCCGGLLCGATIGRVGPTVHIGAAIMYSIGKYMHIQRDYMLKGLIMAGGGAGTAAAFNLPLAGIMFAIEEMGRSFDKRNVSMIIVAIILSGLVAILIHDSDYRFDIVTTVGEDYLQLGIIVVVCSIAGGLIGGLFSRVLIQVTRKLSPVTNRFWLPTAFICGLVIAITGIISGGAAFGSGYIETQAMLQCAGKLDCEGHPGIWYPLYKLVTTIATFVSGIPGGLFVPVLATGTGLGSDLALMFPTELATTVVLITMVAYYSGVMQTPITAFIVVLEITGNNELVFALMSAALIATWTSKQVCKRSLFEALAISILKTLQAGQENAAQPSPKT